MHHGKVIAKDTVHCIATRDYLSRPCDVVGGCGKNGDYDYCNLRDL